MKTQKLLLVFGGLAIVILASLLTGLVRDQTHEESAENSYLQEVARNWCKDTSEQKTKEFKKSLAAAYNKAAIEVGKVKAIKEMAKFNTSQEMGKAVLKEMRAICPDEVNAAFENFTP